MSRMQPMMVEESTSLVPLGKTLQNTDLRSLGKNTCLQCIFTYGYWIPGKNEMDGLCVSAKPLIPDAKIMLNISDCLNNKDSQTINYAWWEPSDSMPTDQKSLLIFNKYEAITECFYEEQFDPVTLKLQRVSFPDIIIDIQNNVEQTQDHSNLHVTF